MFMLVEEVLDPNLADNQERCYSRVATPIRSFARYKVDCPEENKLERCLKSNLSISSSLHQSGDLRTVTDCTQELDSDEEGSGGVGHCSYHVLVSLKPQPRQWDKDKSCAEQHL